MIAVIIILGAALAVMLTLFLLQRKEIKNITRQLNELRGKDTNTLISSENGTADRLITEINLLLKEKREARISYIQKNHAIDQMMTNIAHDIRTPLTSAMGYLDILSRENDPEGQRELGIINKRLVRLKELIDSFFEFSSVISGTKEPELSSVDLTAALEEAVAHYFDDYDARGRIITLDCRPRVSVISNRLMLLRVFDNLISNALKHGEGDLSISVSCGEKTEIAFRNPTSEQIDDPERLFDEFYTTDISRTKGNTGLGLAIAKQFTELLGGSISAEVREGEFIVRVRL
ncbi:MAG: HAMP domain-containing histidine kinase [Ruminococcus sp.]|nr:HAMP domain-containing histidine kinase [Ruminococcus sp.]